MSRRTLALKEANVVQTEQIEDWDPDLCPRQAVQPAKDSLGCEESASPYATESERLNPSNERDWIILVMTIVVSPRNIGLNRCPL